MNPHLTSFLCLTEMSSLRSLKNVAQDVSKAMKPVAAPSTISLCGAGGKASAQRVGLTAAAESIHQLESKIESAVLAKLPQVVAMDQDDVSERVQQLETRFNQMAQRQQQLETVVHDQGASANGTAESNAISAERPGSAVGRSYGCPATAHPKHV